MPEPIIINPEAEKRALVLAGGGAKGSFEARLVWHLEEMGFTWDVVIGVSAGSLNGAKISSGQTRPLLSVWERSRKEDIVTGGFNLWRAFQLATKRKNSLYDTDPLRNLLWAEYHPDDTVIPLVIGVADLEAGTYETFTVEPGMSYDKAEVVDYLMASSAVPVTYPPVRINGRPHVDGGVRNITPLADAIRFDPDQIIVIVAEPLELPAEEIDERYVVDIGGRTLRILLNEIIREDVQNVRRINKLVRAAGGEITDEEGRTWKEIDITVLQPTRPLGDGEDFSEAALRRRFDAADDVAGRIELA